MESHYHPQLSERLELGFGRPNVSSQAIVTVLRERGNPWMTYREVSDVIAAGGLYIRPSDGEPPPPGQISARAHHHLDLFELDKTGDLIRIRLRSSQY